MTSQPPQSTYRSKLQNIISSYRRDPMARAFLEELSLVIETAALRAVQTQSKLGGEDAKEIAQETFCNFLESLATKEGEHSFMRNFAGSTDAELNAYLCKTVLWKAIERNRTCTRRTKIAEEHPSEIDERSGAASFEAPQLGEVWSTGEYPNIAGLTESDLNFVKDYAAAYLQSDGEMKLIASSMKLNRSTIWRQLSRLMPRLKLLKPHNQARLVSWLCSILPAVVGRASSFFGPPK